MMHITIIIFYILIDVIYVYSLSCYSFQLCDSFREDFPVSYCRWKTLVVQCGNDQSIRQLAVSKGDNSKLPELMFNRLQLSDQEYSGLLRRNFGNFVAREAVLDEEYWVCFPPHLYTLVHLHIFFLLFKNALVKLLVYCLSLAWQVAAWLRAEAHWESLSYMRSVL